MQLEGKFPYLQSASIATDYLGKLVTGGKLVWRDFRLQSNT